MILSKRERETLITWNEQDKEANIFTYNKKLQRDIKKKFGIKPILENEYGGMEFVIEKSRIKINLPRVKKRKLTAEQKAKLAKNLIKARAAKKKVTVTVKKSRRKRPKKQ